MTRKIITALALLPLVAWAGVTVSRGKGSVYSSAGSGISSLNALTGATQTFATGTSGSDFAISSSGTAHTFNLPTASGSNRGALSSSDWTTFNGKESALTFSTPISRSVNAISIADAAADGATKGAASFVANDFNATAGNIGIDYTNGQAAASGTKGFLTGADWDTFNGKESALTFSSPLSRAVNTVSLTTVGPTLGGTGIATYATGDILYASASNTLSKLAAGTDGHYLTLSGGVPAWAAVTAGIGGSTGATDNRILRSDGTGGATLQNSPLSIADTTGSITGPADFRLFFENGTTRFMGFDSTYDSNAMRFGVPTSGYFAFTINGTNIALSVDSQEIYWASGMSLRFPYAGQRFGYSNASGAPAPPTHAYFKNIYVDTGANTTIGTSTLVGGTVTVNTTAVATGDLIFCSRNAAGGTTGDLECDTADIVNGTSFVINSSSGTDTSTVNWHILKTF